MNWCGRCDCIEQNYRTLGAKHDGRVKFWSACEDFVPEDVKANLQYGALTPKPRFAVYCDGEIKSEINGADFTKLETTIQKFVLQDE